MPWFRKKPDPISDRARVLDDEIARLDAQIKQLGSQLQQGQSQPRLRSTALPHGGTVNHPAPASPASPLQPAPEEPIFEEVGQDLLKARGEPATTPDHYNELGVRKYDLTALLRRIR